MESIATGRQRVLPAANCYVFFASRLRKITVSPLLEIRNGVDRAMTE